MNILHVCDWYHPIGGTEKLLFDTLSSLEARGHTNVVVYNDHEDNGESGASRPEYACSGLEYFHYFHPGVQVLARQPIEPIKKIITQHKPDVCHIHNFQNPYVTKFLLDTLPCARSIHDPRLYCFTNWKLLPDKSICDHPIGKACIENGCLSKGLFPRTDFDRNAPYILRHYHTHKHMPVLIAESRAQIDTLVKSGFSPEQIEWLPDFTPICPRDEVELFTDEHYQEGELPIILFVGRASYEKGPQVLLKACRHIKSRCKVVLITAGPTLEYLQEQADEFSDMVEVIGGLPYDETKKWYARASCVVVPSVWLENFCLVGLEAYANVTPVIGSAIGGIKDWLRDGETGFLTIPNDPHDLAEKVDLALSNPEKLRQMGRNAYERVCKYYNQDLYLDRLLNIYDNAMKRYRKTS
jgi:glycosyltransferase involved in cell wall biosynthesis